MDAAVGLGSGLESVHGLGLDVDLSVATGLAAGVKYCSVLGYCHRHNKCVGEQMKTIISIRKGAQVYIIEDSDERLKWFAEKMPSASIMHQKDPGVAIYAFHVLPPETFDAIFLDFDLGPGNVRNSTINSLPVAEYLRGKLTSKSAQHSIVIHSQNEPGSLILHTMLPGATRLPFGEFDIKEVY
jgi:hypothetical protein